MKVFTPGMFEREKHFYPKVLNSQIHPLVSYFLTLSTERIVERYCHLNPGVNKDSLSTLLSSTPRFMRWSGADFFYTTKKGKRRMILLETNSCPSGQKSTPALFDHSETAGYGYLIKESFLAMSPLDKGVYAVLFDKNEMECSGYAAALADATGEEVYLVDVREEKLHSKDGFLFITIDGKEIQLKAAYRYVTQRPWSVIPLTTKTPIYNPLITCIAGGRNKAVAAKSYDLFNGEYERSGLKINTPETIYDVNLSEVPLWVQKFKGRAVVKNPYSNAGQGVYIITNQTELESFLALPHRYTRFIVQELIGNKAWSSQARGGRNVHIGTMPNKRKEIYVADVRMMVCSTPQGYRPVAIYARKAKSPLPEKLNEAQNSWDILGTNLSYKEEGQWKTDTSRLLIMDRKDFNLLGIGIDDLIDAFVQTSLATIAIDRMSQKLLNGKFNTKLFQSLNPDQALFDEILLE